MANDWYRGGAWTPEAQDEFERRLRRARPYKRQHYLRVKGLGLEEVGEVEGARMLWNRLLDDPDASWGDRVSTTEHLADSFCAEAPQVAAGYYRKLSELSPTLSGTTGIHHVKLAQLLLETGTAADLPEVGELLSWWVENARVPVPSDRFSWNLAYIKWAQALGDHEGARDGARRALDLASRGPVYPRHPTVGLVHANVGTLEWLRSLAL